MPAAMSSEESFTEKLLREGGWLPGLPGAPMPSNPNMRVGDGTFPGDVGFDPFPFATGPRAYSWYREAEIKHARLAMLAAVGWPVSEFTNFGGLLTETGRAPALLNGGLDQVNPLYWVFCIALGAFFELPAYQKQFAADQSKYVPGDIGWDPLGLNSDLTGNIEIWTGRLAMIAITAYALEEAVLQAPVAFFMDMMARR